MPKHLPLPYNPLYLHPNTQKSSQDLLLGASCKISTSGVCGAVWRCGELATVYSKGNEPQPWRCTAVQCTVHCTAVNSEIMYRHRAVLLLLLHSSGHGFFTLTGKPTLKLI